MPAAARPQFTSGVSLVEVYATVTDARGEPVHGLAAKDFTVEEDDEAQSSETFAEGQFPLALAIGLDRSFSMSRAQLAGAASAVRDLIGALRPDDRVMVLAIGSETEVVAPLSADPKAARDALIGLEPWGTTPLYDAVLQAIDAIHAEPGRRALIILSDGIDRYSRATAAEVVEQARLRGVLLYPVALARTAPPVFAELAAITGGRSQQVTEMRRLPAALSTIARELRSQYLLGYAPKRPMPSRNEWRSIRVRVGRPELRVRARDGYFAQP